MLQKNQSFTEMPNGLDKVFPTYYTHTTQGGNWTQPKMFDSHRPKNFKYSVILHSTLIELEIKAQNKVSDRAFINEV